MKYVEFDAEKPMLGKNFDISHKESAGYLLLGYLGDLWAITTAVYTELRWEVLE